MEKLNKPSEILEKGSSQGMNDKGPRINFGCEVDAVLNHIRSKAKSKSNFRCESKMKETRRNHDNRSDSSRRRDGHRYLNPYFNINNSKTRFINRPGPEPLPPARIQRQEHCPSFLGPNPWLQDANFNLKPLPVIQQNLQPSMQMISPPPSMLHFNPGSQSCVENQLRLNQYSQNIPSLVNMPPLADPPGLTNCCSCKCNKIPGSRISPSLLQWNEKKNDYSNQKDKMIFPEMCLDFRREHSRKLSLSSKTSESSFSESVDESVEGSKSRTLNDVKDELEDKKLLRLQKFSDTNTTYSVDGNSIQGHAFVDNDYIQDYLNGIEKQRQKREEILNKKLQKRKINEGQVVANNNESPPAKDFVPIKELETGRKGKIEKFKEANLELNTFSSSFKLTKFKSKSMEDLSVLRAKLPASMPVKISRNLLDVSDSVENKTPRVVKKKFPVIALRKLKPATRKVKKNYKKHCAMCPDDDPKKLTNKKSITDRDKMFPIVVIEKMPEIGNASQVKPRRKYQERGFTCTGVERRRERRRKEFSHSEFVSQEIKDCYVRVEKLSEDLIKKL